MTIEAAFFGTLGRDAELKTSKNGREYLRLNIRCGDGDGAQWINVMAFDPEAIAACDKLVKGSRVYVEGSLTLSEWTGKDGETRHGLSVMSWHCRLAAIGRNKPRKDKPEPRSNTAAAGGNFHSDPIPFAPEWR